MASATAGKITVYPDGKVAGPVDYIRSEAFQACCRRIERGESAVVTHAPAGIPFLQLLATAIQTDYAAWAGAQEMARRIGG